MGHWNYLGEDPKPKHIAVISSSLADFRETMKRWYFNGYYTSNKKIWTDGFNFFYPISNNTGSCGRCFDSYISTPLSLKMRNYLEMVWCLEPSIRYNNKDKWDNNLKWNINLWVYDGI